jgi:Ca2+:H+ antiporter
MLWLPHGWWRSREAQAAHTLLFVLSVLAIVPLAALLSHATESVAAKTGDAVGGLLNATLGNLTELVIALTALHAGQYMLVKASVAGAIVTNSLFMLGASFLLGGLKHHVQEYNRASARLQAGLLFPHALLIIGSRRSRLGGGGGVHRRERGLAVLLICLQLGMLFAQDTMSCRQCGTHRNRETPWPVDWPRTLAGVTILVAPERDLCRVSAGGGRGIR